MKTINIAIIGLGARARNFFIPELIADSERYNVVALCDISHEQIQVTQQYLSEHQLPFSGSYYEDLDDCLNHHGLDAVAIATTDNLHVEPAVKALAKGIHVLGEKPLATTIEDCTAIAQAIEASSASFYLGFNMRHIPVYKKAREWVHSGKLGNIHMIRGYEYYYDCYYDDYSAYD